MLAQHRLRHEMDITKVLKTKKGVFDSVCGIKFRKNNLAVSRFAIITSTKVSKNAVDRNKLRRQYRELLTKLMPKIVKGYDVLLLTSKPALVTDYAEKDKKLQYVFRKAGLLVA